jgi:hypothetical protein
MKKPYMLVSLFLFCCSHKLSLVENDKLEDGLYYGDRKGFILSSSQLYATIKKDTAYVQIFYKEAVELSILFQDTLVKKNDTLFIGTQSSIIKANKIFLTIQDSGLKNLSKNELSRADDKALKQFNINNNLILYQSIYKKYFDTYSKLNDSIRKERLYKKYYEIGKKIYEDDQKTFLKEIIEFKKNYLND